MRLSRSVVVALIFFAVAFVAGSAEAQVGLCSGYNVSTSSGTTFCDGSGSALTASATVRNAVVLTLDEVFGSAATGLTASFGDVDALCAGVPASGISCAPDEANNTAVWYGALKFTVRMAGASGLTGPSTVRLTGIRNVAGTMPLGQLLDGPSGAAPATAYLPVVPINLKAGIPNGRTVVMRSLGLKVSASDAPGTWSTTLVYDIVME